MVGTPRVCGKAAIGIRFDGPATTWQLLDTGIPARILAQACVPTGARDNAGAERIVAVAPAGQSVMLATPIDRVAVLPELQLRIWVQASRPAVQLAVRVAFPRSIDPKTGSPRTAIVRGEAYSRPGQWQQLNLADVPKLLAAEIRVLRAMSDAIIDPREAYLDSVALIVPGAPGGIEVLTDELEVDGVLLPTPDAPQPAGYTAELAEDRAGTASADSIRLQGGLLLVNEKPFLPRVIQWQGEPLAFLAELGFNAVQLPRMPTEAELGEARQHGLWFVCPPPQPEALARDGIGRSGDGILAWLVNDAALEVDPKYAARWSELIRQHDPIAGRPVVIAPEFAWTAANQAADILIAHHPALTQVSAAEFGPWLNRLPSRTQPGTPLWAAFATQLGDVVRRQSAALVGEELPPLTLDAAHLDALVRVAATSGVRGFVFLSDSPLNRSDPATRRRAAALELRLRQLRLIEPWLASGNLIGRIATSDAAASRAVLHVDNARLLIPIADAAQHGSTDSQSVASTGASQDVFLVPGVPESSQVFALSSTALRTLAAQRVAGGMRVVVPAADDALVLITEDPQVIQAMREQIARDGRRTLQLRRDLAIQLAALLAENARQLAQLGYGSDSAARAAASAEAQLRQSEALLAAGRAEQAREAIITAQQTLQTAAAEQRHRVVQSAALESNPLSLSNDLLAAYAAFERSSGALQRGENLLYGGDFEDVGQMTQLGWQHVRHPAPDVESRVELSPRQPKHGAYCLELVVAATASRVDTMIAHRAPAWIVSPPIPVDEGQLLEITGWVHLDEPIEEPGGALQIRDSLGGRELSLAVHRTSGWQPFRMLRAATESGELRLSFGVEGVGTARVDAVMVRPLEPLSPRRLPPVSPAQSAPDANMARGRIRLLPATQSR